MKAFALVLLAAFALLGAGCESIGRGTEQEVAIETTPAGATVRLSDGQSCSTPCRLTVPRYHHLIANVSKADCRSTFAHLGPSVTGAPGWDAPDLYRTIYDYQLGGAYDIEPVPLTMTLVCGEAARQPPPGMTPHDEELLAQFGKLSDTIEAVAPDRPKP